MANYSFLDTTTDPAELYIEVGKHTDGTMPIGILVGVFVVIFVAMRRQGRDIDEIFIYAGAFEFIMVTLFIVIEWLSYYFIMVPVAFLLVGILLNRLKGG